MLSDVKVIIAVISVSVLFFGCAQKSKVHHVRVSPNVDVSQTVFYTDPAVFDKVEFVDNSKSPAAYLAMNVSFAPMNEMRLFLEKKEKVTLKHRGEAHITVISPPEYEKLRKYISMALINEVASLNRIQETPFETICLARGVKKEDKKTLSTYYVVVEAPELVALRNKVASIFRSHGGSSDDFNAEDFYPHITIGFTDRDLHASDGIIKSKSSCLIEMQLKDQSPP